MLLHRLYDDGLAQASYLVGCEKAREAVIVDPNRDPGQYERLAAGLGLRIAHVTETHVHADFVSGARDLAARTGATLHLSGAGDYAGYDYPKDEDWNALSDGDAIEVGAVALQCVHTPGHTPEHMSFVVTDTAASNAAVGAFTGDFLFVGDVGRPDLLERSVGVAGSAASAARQLFASLRAFARRPDYLQIWPGHGAGSACGKSLSATPHSTLGYERLSNWALQIDDEAEFVRRVLRDQTEPPAYFAEMKRVNRAGPRKLDSVRKPVEVGVGEILAALQTGSVVLDTRPASVFAREHVAGAINVPLGKSFSTWVGSVVPYDLPVYVITDVAPRTLAEAALRQLSLIGVDEVRGWATWEALSGWRDDEFPLTELPQMPPNELAALRDDVQLVDVRNTVEWNAGHIPGAKHIPLAELRQRMDELHGERPIVVHCQAGGRAAVAASLLAAGGLRQVTNLAGGYAGWREAGLPVQSGAER